MKKIIYDFGANNGQNLKYYLSRSDLVIAVEANPNCCRKIKEVFSNEILNKKLILINCAVSNSYGKKYFYISKIDDAFSTIIKSKMSSNFKKKKINFKLASQIIKKYGNPYYVKIDVEFADHFVLKDLFKYSIFPQYISFEAHNLKGLQELMRYKKYLSFKIIDHLHVQPINKYSYKNDKKKKSFFNFSHDSAGPFGNDICGPWLNKNNFTKLFNFIGPGYKDIHCSLIDFPSKNIVQKFFILRIFLKKRNLKKFLNYLFFKF